jgi:phosphoribosylformimino-5-aminoimidazole carboxamide ribotide isomerase
VSFTVFPAVDISDGRCVRPLQGRFGTEQVYSDDPIRVALGFCRAGARWLHIVDLDGARTGETINRELVLEVIRSAACPVQAGGGLTTDDEVTDVIAAGAGRALLAPAVLEDRRTLRNLCERFADRIGVSLDARKTADGWTVGGDIPLLDAVLELDAAGVSLFVYTDVERDGSMAGPDVDGLLRLVDATSRRVVASGGISSLEDVRAVARLHGHGVKGACVGRALYENKFGIFEAQHQADEAAAGRDAGGPDPR